MPAPSSPTSPRDPRYYLPRRPSPLSLPPLAPHMAFQGPSTHHVTFQAPSHGFQAFAALAVPNTAHEQGGRVYKEPRYPLEAQRRFLSEARKALNEVKRDKDEEQVCVFVFVALSSCVSSSDYCTAEIALPNTAPCFTGDDATTAQSAVVSDVDSPPYSSQRRQYCIAVLPAGRRGRSWDTGET